MSMQVGAAHVAIFPVMKGFRSKVAREVDAAGKDTTSRFGRSSQAAGQEGGSRFGRAFRTSLNSQDLASPGLKRLEAEVRNASASVANARRAEADAAGKVRAAEANLESARTASTAASKQLQRAEENAARARAQYGEGSKQAEAAEKQLDAARAKASSSAARVVSAEERLESATRKLEAAKAKTTGETERLTRAQQTLAQVTDSTSASVGGLAGKLSTAFGGLGQKVSGAANAMLTPLRTVGSKAASMLAPVGRAFAPIGHAAANAGRAIASNLGSAFQAAGKAAITAGGIIVGVFTSQIGPAVQRVDTLNNFPKMMQNIGYSAEEAEASISKLSKGIDGLPTTLDGIAATTRKLAPLTGSLEEATDLAIAMNNAFLAGGASTMDAARGMEQYLQMLAVGKVDMQSWRTMQETMPGPLAQTAKALLGAEASTMDLYEALQSGKVTFDDFNSAILKLNEEGADGMASFAEQAQDAVKGIETSWQNVKTAVRNAVAEIIQAIGAERIYGMFDGIKAAINDFGQYASGALSILIDGEFNPDNWPGFDQNSAPVRFFYSLRDAIDYVTGPISEISMIIGGGLLGALGGLASHLPIVGGLFTGLTGPVGLTVGAIAALLTASEPLRDALGELAAAVGESLQAAFETLSPVIGTLLEELNGLLGVLGDALAPLIEALTPILTTVIEIVADAVASVLPALVPIIEQIVKIISMVATVIVDHVMPVIEKLLPVVADVFSAISETIGAALSVISAVIETVMAVISGDWDAAWAGIGKILDSALKLIGKILETALQVIWAVITAALEVIKGIWNAAWTWISNLLSSIWEKITSLVSNAINAVKSTISSVLENIKSIWRQGWNTVSDFVGTAFSNIATGIRNGIGTVVSFVAQLPGKILGAIGNLGKLMFDSGMNIIKSFGNGIKNAFGSVVNAVGNGLSRVRRLLPFSPAKEGPFSGRGWVTYSGKSIAEGLAEGIRSRENAPVDAAASLAARTHKALSGMDSTFAVPYPTGTPTAYGRTPGHGTPAHGGITINVGAVNNPVAESTSTTISRELQRAAAGVGNLV